MKPEKTFFYIYAESPEEITELQNELYRFVDDKYRKGILVTADKLTRALRSFGSSPLINGFLNGK